MEAVASAVAAAATQSTMEVPENPAALPAVALVEAASALVEAAQSAATLSAVPVQQH